MPTSPIAAWTVALAVPAAGAQATGHGTGTTTDGRRPAGASVALVGAPRRL